MTFRFSSKTMSSVSRPKVICLGLGRTGVSATPLQWSTHMNDFKDYESAPGLGHARFRSMLSYDHPYQRGGERLGNME